MERRVQVTESTTQERGPGSATCWPWALGETLGLPVRLSSVKAA